MAGALAAYAALVLAAFLTGNLWLDAAAALVLVTLLLSPALGRGSAIGWLLWLLGAAGFVWLAVRGNGRLALDAMPVFVNAALCGLFARTLRRGREPLIASIIEVLEGAERLALPRVAGYARGLTQAWAWLFGAQAMLLALIVLCAVPDGLLASFAVAPPIAVPAGWRWYLHLGSYALFLGFMVGEYTFRRWYLRHIPHAPLPLFITRLARRWPALVRRFADDAARGDG